MKFIFELTCRGSRIPLNKLTQPEEYNVYRDYKNRKRKLIATMRYGCDGGIWIITWKRGYYNHYLFIDQLTEYLINDRKVIFIPGDSIVFQQYKDGKRKETLETQMESYIREGYERPY